jgi:hypothetical protein
VERFTKYREGVWGFKFHWFLEKLLKYIENFWVDHWDGGRSSKERYSDYVLAENKEISMRDLIFVNGEN